MKLKVDALKDALSRSLRATIKWAPADLQRLARFMYRLPVYYAEDLSYQRVCANGVGRGVLMPTDDLQIVVPSDRIASSVYSSFFFERASTLEWKAFLALAEGCRSFIDVGASGGLFSVLFACSRGPCEILSIEPDPPSIGVLEDARALNTRPEIERWLIDTRAVGDEKKKVTFLSTGYGAEILRENANELTRAFAVYNRREARAIDIEVERFDAICATHDFRPDLIKMDIESYEYELIASSLAFLEASKPRIHLELHVKMLRDRGLDPGHPLRLLEGLGYRPMNERVGQPLFAKRTALATAARGHLDALAQNVEVTRLDLVCD